MTTRTRRRPEVSVETSDTAQPMLSMRGVSKRYASTGKIAVQHVDLEIQQGEFVSFVGPSGCGKTTLLKLATGLIEASTGEIRSQGAPGSARPGEYGLVFQKPTLLPWRTVEKNVLLPASVQHADMREARARAHTLLSMVGLGDAAKLYPGELSGGMQQRASIARALLMQPRVLFMDEPFGALDAITREDLNFQVLDLHRELSMTTVLVTHNIDEAVLMSDRILVMSANPGRVEAELEVTLERPRSVATMSSDGYRALTTRARELMSAGSTPKQER